jgi:hypothetical protein
VKTAMHKPKKIIGYEGPSGAYAVVGGQVKPLSEPSALVALTDAALLTSLGYSERAAQYQGLAQSRRQPVTGRAG